MTDTTGRPPNGPPASTEIRCVDVLVRGYRWSGGPNWIVLLHAPGQDIDSWADLPAILATGADGVLAIDLPGHGLSDDPWDPSRATELVTSLCGHVRGLGAARCFVVAAEQIADAALRSHEIDALVAVSPIAEAAVPGPTPPTLILVGGLDREAAAAADRFFRQTRGWAVLSALGTAAQGAALFRSGWGDHAREQVVGFFRDYRIDER